MDRQELMESIRAYQPFNEQEKMDKSLILDWIETQPGWSIRIGAGF